MVASAVAMSPLHPRGGEIADVVEGCRADVDVHVMVFQVAIHVGSPERRSTAKPLVGAEPPPPTTAERRAS
jgi:hypothetical protein